MKAEEDAKKEEEEMEAAKKALKGKISNDSPSSE